MAESKLVELVKYVDDGAPIFRTDVLECVIRTEQAQSLPVLVVSIAGEAQSGKSFLLSTTMAYLHYLKEVSFIRKSTFKSYYVRL